MKLRNLIMTGVLTITLFGGITTISNADSTQQGYIKMVDELQNNKRQSQFKHAVEDTTAPLILGSCTPLSEHKNKKTIDYKRLIALEDSLNYATLKSFKPKQLKMSKKDYKAIEKHLKAKAENSALILEGKKGVKVPKLTKKLEKTMLKKIAVAKIALLDPQRFDRSTQTSEYITFEGYKRNYINIERNELIDKGLSGKEAGALLSAEEVLQQSIEGNFKQAHRFQKELQQEIKNILDI